MQQDIPPRLDIKSQEALINALSHQKHTLIYFHSAACNLCRSISGIVTQVSEDSGRSVALLSNTDHLCQPGPSPSDRCCMQEHAKRSQSLSLCSICTDGTQAFAPEVMLGCYCCCVAQSWCMVPTGLSGCATGLSGNFNMPICRSIHRLMQCCSVLVFCPCCCADAQL